ncbi:MAG TPA: hypothetical protein VK644_03205 [Chitinophagaceae bacterium]|nr:hypothetical protein [Chitinophagaceae bacterium]
MKATNKIILAVAAGAAAGIVFYAWRRHKSSRMLRQVADEGYETAHDILFPEKRFKGRRLRYGAVLPK